MGCLQLLVNAAQAPYGADILDLGVLKVY